MFFKVLIEHFPSTPLGAGSAQRPVNEAILIWLFCIKSEIASSDIRRNRKDNQVRSLLLLTNIVKWSRTLLECGDY